MTIRPAAPSPRKRVLPGVRRRHIVLVAGLIIAGLAALDVLLLIERPLLAHHLLYTSDGYLHAINLATGEDRLLGGGGSLDPREVASPDGLQWAYWDQAAGGGWDLIVQTPGDASTRVTLGTFDLRFPTLAWSPDGMRLAFGISTTGEAEGTELVILDVATGEIQQLTDNAFRDDSPAWSPDGRQLVFTSGEDGYNRLHVIDVATGERHLLTDQAFGYVPVWSPDGRLIAFVSNHEDGHGDIYLIGADGNGLRRLTFTPATDDNPTWLP